MKKALKIIGLILIAVIVIIGIYIYIPPKTLDFRGTVTEIEVLDNKTTFHIEQTTGASYIVVADGKTKVSHCHEDDPDISLVEIVVGDKIEGDYRWLSSDNKAKYITVWCEK